MLTMRMTFGVICGCVLGIAAAGTAFPDSASSPGPSQAGTGGPEAVGEVIVTARRREESLQNVPIAVTALSGDFLQDQQVVFVKDIAAYAPGVNINSDSTGRSFVSMRGIGTTLINTVQPGVGIFIDGIYEPDTSYLNSPIVDVERIEVLRGPQGTLFGNNTLGGAISVITRQPTDIFEGYAIGSYAGPDDFYSAALSLSGPIIPGVLLGRIALADHAEDGFGHNLLAGGYAYPLNDRSINTTLRYLAADAAVFTLNTYYNRIFGGSTPYSEITGPTDYTANTTMNQNNTITFNYKGANLKGVFDVAPLSTTLTAVIAYDRRDDSSGVDGDYGPVDLLRAFGTETLETKTGELRFDTQFNESFSTLFGVFANRISTDQAQTVILSTFLQPPFPAHLEVPTAATSEANQQGLYGNAFWKFADTWELSAGLRYDHQVLGASNNTTAGDYKASEWEPRLQLTQHWNPDLMTYASIARGFRGGGQNGPGAPNLLYKGDSVVTEEIGAKITAFDHRLSFDTDVFYNNYAHAIAQNSLAPSTGGVGFVAINLNTGQIRSYGLEIESHFQATEQWRIDGTLTLKHARIINGLEYLDTTGKSIPSDRVLFDPDWNYSLDTVYSVPVRDGRDSVDFMLGAVGKGSRVGSTLTSTATPTMPAYSTVDASITYKLPHLEVAVFGTNLTDKPYYESYLDKSLLLSAGLPPALASDLGVEGDRRRVGIRAKYSF